LSYYAPQVIRGSTVIEELGSFMDEARPLLVLFKVFVFGFPILFFFLGHETTS
jgi:hypothetical protein